MRFATGLRFAAAGGTSRFGSGDTPGAPGSISLSGGMFAMSGGEIFAGTINHPCTGNFNFTGGTLQADTFIGNLADWQANFGTMLGDRKHCSA